MITNPKHLSWLQETYRTGHFWHPAHQDCWNVRYKYLERLNLTDQVVIDAFRSRSDFQVYPYAHLVVNAHQRAPQFDGEIGPALSQLLDVERCGFPDYPPPPGVTISFPDDPDLEEVCRRMRGDQAEAGVGNWKNCNGHDGFHSAAVLVDRRGMGQHLIPVFDQVIRKVTEADRRMGHRWYHIDKATNRDFLSGKEWTGRINVDASFQDVTSGWAGLAILGHNQTCTSRIWAKFWSRYRGGSTPAEILNQWWTLWMHELTHNKGRGHTRGGVMNPSLRHGLPMLWTPQDPSYQWHVQQFGGVPVGEDIPPPDDDQLTARVKALEEEQAVQQVTLAVHGELLKFLMNR